MRTALWVIGIVVVATIAAIAGSNNQGDDVASNLPRPSAAFCKAAQKYDTAVSDKPHLPLARHVELTHAIAVTAPEDAKADATLIWKSFVRLQRGDRTVVDNPRVKTATEHVNWRAGQDCGWYRRQGM
ncbi:MAG: hypothetical protein ACXV8T_07900 [Acidimicrobiia bacterium]